jgi:hypothetical protein
MAKTTGAWAAGTGNGGIDTGSIAASTTYHWFVIRNPSGPTVDVLFSLSATAPTLPSGYTQFRRIGSVRTNASSQWIIFIQDGDQFMWDVPFPDVLATNPGISAVTRTLTVPTGIRVNALLSVGANGPAANADLTGAIYVSDLSLSDVAPHYANASSYAAYMPAQTGQVVMASRSRCMTNLSGQVRSRCQLSSTNTVASITTYGWVDLRGKD